MTTLKNLIGQRFHKLTVIARDGSDKRGEAWWLCQCDCGQSHKVRGSHLRRGLVTSCGCVKSAKTTQRNTVHGLCGTALYLAWCNAVKRCYRTNDRNYRHYGGRGIRVCESIRASATNLYFLLGDRPTGLTLGRINNDGHYSCGSCAECFRCQLPLNIRWETPKQQQRNRGNNLWLTLQGKRLLLSEWARQLGMSTGNLKRRIKLQIDPFKPLRSGGRRPEIVEVPS